MVQQNPNCGKMWKDSVGYHMCMQIAGHAGPCVCGHGEPHKGTPLFKNIPGAGAPSGQGHMIDGYFGDQTHPIPKVETEKPKA